MFWKWGELLDFWKRNSCLIEDSIFCCLALISRYVMSDVVLATSVIHFMAVTWVKLNSELFDAQFSLLCFWPFDQFLLHFTFLVASPKRKFSLIESGCDSWRYAINSLISGATTVAWATWDTLYLSHPICLPIHLSVDTIILTHKILFVPTAHVKYLLCDYNK